MLVLVTLRMTSFEVNTSIGYLISFHLLQGFSPMIPASWRNDLKVVKMLRKAGADMSHITKTGWSPLTASLKNTIGSMGGELALIEPTVEYLLKKAGDIGGCNAVQSA